jgi:hypothetical protein
MTRLWVRKNGILLTKKMSIAKVTILWSSHISVGISMTSCRTTGGVVLTVLPFNISMLRPHTFVAVLMSFAVRGQSLIMFDWSAQVMSESDRNAKPA